MIQRHMPMGYRIVDGKAEIVPEKAAIVRNVFHSYLQGTSTYKMAKEMTTQGILNASHKASWNHGSVGKLLENQKYRGDEFYPPIIDLPTFEAVQKRRREQSIQLGRTVQPNSFANRNLMSGRLWCGECGQPYRQYVEHCNQPGEKTNWKCKQYINGNRVHCRNIFLTDEQIIMAFLEVINRVIRRPEMLGRIPTKQQAPAYLVDRMSEQIQERLECRDCPTENIKELIFERARLQYQNANIEDGAYQTGKLKEALAGCGTQIEYDETLFSQTIKQVKIFKNGRLVFYLENGVTVETIIN